MQINCLLIIIEKTNFMLFSHSWRVLPYHISIDDNIICQVNTTKFLGLHIDKELTWKTHINYLSKILSRNTGILNKLKHFFPTHILQSIYSSLISPYLNYGILAWGKYYHHLTRCTFSYSKTRHKDNLSSWIFVSYEQLISPKQNFKDHRLIQL